MVISYQDLFYHYTGGWLATHKRLVLDWINKILHPVVELHTVAQLKLFLDNERPFREVTPFFENKYPHLGSFYKESHLRTRVIFAGSKDLE